MKDILSSNCAICGKYALDGMLCPECKKKNQNETKCVLCGNELSKEDLKKGEIVCSNCKNR